MNSETVIEVTLAALLVVGIALGVFVLVISKKHKRIVLESSSALARVRELNVTHQPRLTYPRSIDYDWVDWVNSKAQFDRYSLGRFLRAQLALYEDFISAQITEQVAAVTAYTEYWDSYAALEQTELGKSASDRLGARKFARIERKLFARARLPGPVYSARVRCTVRYTSPQGRNSYYAYQVWGFDELVNELQEVRRTRELQSTTKYLRDQERQRMTPDLRYQVLKRDKFRCRGCGATSDTETLHVDHIHPVAKGGKTVIENLQALCQTCNLGKSDRH